MRSCYFCQTEIDPLMTIGHQSLCPNCGRDLKVCLNCKFYSPSSYKECTENIEEHVINKDIANFCDHFVMGVAKSKGSTKKKEDALKAFNSLFNDDF
ncbi:MAG: hypothetical protein ACOXZZ_04455 [Sphaerochaetaceae bacterium]